MNPAMSKGQGGSYRQYGHPGGGWGGGQTLSGSPIPKYWSSTPRRDVPAHLRIQEKIMIKKVQKQR